MSRPTRRLMLQALSLAALLPRPALASRAELEQALRTFTQGQPLNAGEVQLDIAPLIENGNAVPVTLSTRQPVQVLALFNELNPQREVLQAQLQPSPAGARLSTRIRLATSQQLVAVAQTPDGRWWSHRVDVIVTLAACIEGG
ncbi:thiosulfate oxidation carrier protein SoxY [Roseateles depolymerans]|uniref:Sulfur oxidation protein SoxY n=1 Tax=Roseateles depolymerans TaxID=76731 RepID=A0A0U2UBG7_9BURK|nr:thiosulfate oxidation carrier protein SoxY [Roseateles depolymerans]ALV09217.1 Sulfur oxidation protein SoxY [Roseateles depolymerans]REG13974.1 sulfur-oxidizing protein SoxY [Roseateles depolymerans]